MSGKKQGRPNWTRSMTVAICAGLAAVVFGYLGGSETVATDRYFFDSTAGAVLFDHGDHRDEADTCVTCHHTLYGAAQATSCEECHDDEVEPSEFEHGELKEFHGRDCSACHEQVAEDDEAASCRQCHPTVQEREERGIGCTECHDDDYEPEMMGHDEYLEIEDHTCLGCHAPSSISEAYHTNCTDCHLETATERFTNDDGTVNCSGCHLR